MIYWWMFILRVETRDIDICSLSKESTWRFVLVTRHYLFLCKARDHPFMDFIVILLFLSVLVFYCCKIATNLATWNHSNLFSLSFQMSEVKTQYDWILCWRSGWAEIKVWAGTVVLIWTQVLFQTHWMMMAESFLCGCMTEIPPFCQLLATNCS